MKMIAKRVFRKRIAVNIKLKEVFKLSISDTKLYQVLGIELSRDNKKVIIKCKTINNEFKHEEDLPLVSLILDADSRVYI